MPKKAKGKPQGRAGQKAKSKKAGTPKGKPPWHQSPGFIALDDDNPYKSFRGFAQASGSPSSFSPRDMNVKLRHIPISFISAGTNTPAESDPEPSSKKLDPREEEDDNDDDEDVIDFDEPFDDEGLQTNIMTEVEVPQGAMAHMHISTNTTTTLTQTSHTEIEAMVVEDISTGHLPEPKASPEPEPLSFIIDTEGDESLASRFCGSAPITVARSPSPAPSDSSEEVVVFHGRNKARVIDDPVIRHSKPQPKPQPKHQPRSHVTDGLLAALNNPIKSATAKPSERKPTGWAAQTTDSSLTAKEPAKWTPAPAEPFWRKPKGQPRPDLDPSVAELAALEDAPARQVKVMFHESTDDAQNAEATVASLQADRKRTLQQKKAIKPANRRSKSGRKKGNRELKADLPSEDDDSDGEAAYIDYMENLRAQLDAEDSGDATPDLAALEGFARSGLLSGPSIVVDGRAVEEDELLNSDLEIDDEESDSSSGEIIDPDLSELSGLDGALEYSDLDSSELEEELEYDEQEQWEDEEDLRQRRIDRMSDEQVARLFAKQAELGIDGDDLVLDDGMFTTGDDTDGVGDLDEARAGLKQFIDSSFGKPAKRAAEQRRRGKGAADNFPDASALADVMEQYGEGGFDIMDLDRPSLRPTKKGRKGRLPPELEALSDDDLKDEMRGQWENDRSKKRLKKAEREAHRAQGMLGSTGKKGKADLSQKYLEGMNMAQVREELRIFLSDDGQQSRPFPPMEKNDRKALHEIANHFNLKSKSVGTGKNRAPVLYKTSRTLPFSDSAYNRAAVASSRGYFSNNGKPNKFAKKGKAGTGGGFSSAAVSLRHGEIVGAGAAEIGKDNFGHRLMEKMGWTKGTALGKDGEGMLLPVTQMMRSGKAGLG